MFGADQNPSVWPGAIWKELMLQPTIIKLYFELHLKVRHVSELAYHTLNCLMQLSSLNGSTMTKKENCVGCLNYLCHFLLKPMLFFPPVVLANALEDLLKST